MTRILSHFAAAAAVALVPMYVVRGQHIWDLQRDRLLEGAASAAAYFLAAGLLELARRKRWRIRWFAPAAAMVMAFGLAALVLLMLGGTYSRRVLLTALALAAALLTLSLVRRVVLLPAAAAAAIAFAGLLAEPAAPVRLNPDQPVFLATAHAWLDMRTYRNRLSPGTTSGGALAPLDDGYLLATGDGRMYHLRFDADTDSLAIRRLKIDVPINGATFAATADTLVSRDGFRVADILVRRNSAGMRLLASHHFWHADSACVAIRVSLLDTSAEVLAGEAEQHGKWSTLFESKPCMPLVYTERMTGFYGIEVGGSMAALDDERILLALGHHGFDGVDTPLMVSQDSAYDLGKTILIEERTGRSRHYTSGHRNPQGLDRGSDGRIWLAEQGPQGGDELNLIADSANYGWPLETYGTQYSRLTWPLTATPGEHEKYKPPIFSWVPSAAVSSVVESRGRAVPAWRGDLLLGSLRDMSVWRVRVRHDRAVFTERIPVNARVRDLVEGEDGRIVIWAGNARIISLRPSRTPRTGNALFAAHCASCHTVQDGTKHGIGPDLHGVVGRLAAPDNGFEYSAAMQALHARWSPDFLFDYLENPARVVPGTSMQFAGLPDSVARIALIRYLSGR